MKTNFSQFAKIVLIVTFSSLLNNFVFAGKSNTNCNNGNITFDAVSNTNKINLNWVISAEANDNYFEVERSYDEKDFKTVGLVLGAQSENATSKQFSFREGVSQFGEHTIIYYRLKQVNADSQVLYSEVKAVNLSSSKATKSCVQVFPNPYMEKITVNFSSQVAGAGKVRLISTVGQVIATQESQITKGNNAILINNLNEVAPGLYYIETSINGKVIDNQKIVK